MAAPETRGEMGQETADSLHAKNSRDSLQRDDSLRLPRISGGEIYRRQFCPANKRESVIQLRILARPAFIDTVGSEGETLLPRY